MRCAPSAYRCSLLNARWQSSAALPARGNNLESSPSNRRSGSAVDDDLEIAAATLDANADRSCVAMQSEVYRCIADAQIADPDLPERRRQYRMVEGQFLARRIDRNAETRLQQHEHGTRGPGLRRTRDGITRRALAVTGSKAAEQFGQSR